MQCAICGENTLAFYRQTKLQTLCRKCDKETPSKVAKSIFLQEYFGDELPNVPKSAQKEFYADYLASVCNVQEYIEQTTGLSD